MTTIERIRALRNEALSFGDLFMVSISEQALADGEGSPAWLECESVLQETQAQREVRYDSDSL